ncbi:MAG: GNAT family N-acetyltransferase [Candidatus Acidiferrales bacterium]
MNLCLADVGDAESITQVVSAAFRVERFFIDRDRINPEKVRTMLHQGNFLLAKDVGRLIGCVYVEIRRERAYFGLLAVDPSRQKEGLGHRLIAAAEDYGRAAGCQVMDIRVVNLREELPPFYRRLGYQETGTEPFAADAHPKQPCHFIIMSKPLR